MPYSVDLSKLSDTVKNNVVKKTVNDKFIEKLNNIDTTGFDLETICDRDISNLAKKNINADKKISDANQLAKKRI